MFASDGSFAYSSNGTSFRLSVHPSDAVDNSTLKASLSIVDKLFDVTTAPINSILSLLNSVGISPQDTKVCYFGRVHIVSYQKMQASYMALPTSQRPYALDFTP